MFHRLKGLHWHIIPLQIRFVNKIYFIAPFPSTFNLSTRESLCINNRVVHFFSTNKN